MKSRSKTRTKNILVNSATELDLIQWQQPNDSHCRALVFACHAEIEFWPIRYIYCDLYWSCIAYNLHHSNTCKPNGSSPRDPLVHKQQTTGHFQCVSWTSCCFFHPSMNCDYVITTAFQNWESFKRKYMCDWILDKLLLPLVGSLMPTEISNMVSQEHCLFKEHKRILIVWLSFVQLLQYALIFIRGAAGRKRVFDLTAI